MTELIGSLCTTVSVSKVFDAGILFADSFDGECVWTVTADRDDGEECADADGSLDGDADRNFNDTLFVEL